jgi:alanine dehydrogenase
MTQPTSIITQSDVRRLVSRSDYLGAIEQAFRLSAEGDALAPPPLHIPAQNGGLHAKGALLRGNRDYVAVKVNSNFPGNSALGELPTIQGALLLFDAANGALLAIMDSIEITVMRTAAASALAGRLLARQDAHTITICGCGAQAAAQVAALADVRQFRRGFAWDLDEVRAQALASAISERLHVPFEVPRSLAEAARVSDVIVTCTTACEPFLDETLAPPGVFIAAVGADAPAKNEIAPTLMASASVFADVTEQVLDMGDFRHAVAAGLATADHLRGELADLVSGRVPGRTSEEEIVIFDSTGTAIEDVASAAIVYERALEADVRRVELAGA